ncbi:delta-type opioid receptor-like [Saccostrea echinata]|uniref:delta-type opioid receptor-like n=1 Tax=Saccostrea echinata TaxID=191078 RepID=UPI002A7F1428|nr:delta-type opioid receptor-like [Saccostrea echinata]
MANRSDDNLLNKWNEELSNVLLPNSVFLAICIAVGFIGNVLVIFIYGFKLRGAKERYFIPILALADLLAVTETSGFNISYNFNPVEYDRELLCKWGWFFGYLTAMVSIFLLVVIAIQRYLKICRPFAKQMSLKWKRVAVLCSCVLAAVLSAPIPVTYGLDPAYNERYKVTGSACRRLTQENRLLSLSHAIVCNVLVFVFVWVLILLYTLIGQRIYKQLQQWDRGQKLSTINKKENQREDDSENTNQRNKPTMFRITFMFMLISFIFIVSFSPKVVIFILECIDDRFWDSMTYSTRLLVRFFDVLFIVNNIANPLVYAFLDVKFSQELKKIFCDFDYSL